MRGTLPQRCVDVLEASVLHTVSESKMHATCGEAVGCVAHYSDEGADILLTADDVGQSVDTIAHEYLHVVLQCANPASMGDPSHRARSDKGVDMWAGLR